MANSDANTSPKDSRSLRDSLGEVLFYFGIPAITLVLIFLAGCEAASAPEPSEGESANRDEIQDKIQNMSLEEKVGQIFMLQAYGQSAYDRDPAAVEGNQKLYGVDTIEEVIDKYKPGGIAYFAGPGSEGIPNNVDNPRQIAALSNGIQQAATSQHAGIPMLISTDQEQGLVVRVTEPATQFPGNMALGATRNADCTERAAEITGEELRAMGINQDFAPVADVNVNPENPVIGIRSFGSTPDLVGSMVAAQVNGYQKNVAATAKHFPGHGDTDTDSHTELPIINHSKEEIQETDLPPFESAIESGVDAIMTAHIVVPALDDSGRPATLSGPILTGVLREELDHEGVIITDALGMDALQQFGQDRVPVEAIEAGADVLLMPPEMDVAYNAVLDAVRSEEVSEKRIDESVYRILELKQGRGLFENPYVDEGAIDSAVGTPQDLASKAALTCTVLSDIPLISTIPGMLSYFWWNATLRHEDVAKAITDQTITLVKNDGGTLPLQANSDEKALVSGHGGIPSGANAVEDLAEDMSKRGVGTDSFETGAMPDDATIAEAVSRAEESDLIIVITGWAWALEQQQKLVQALLGTGKPVVVAAVADPYDIAYFPEADTYLATYGFRAVSMEALARVLFGEVKPSGKLPVSLPAANDPENTLYPYGYGLSY